MGQHHSMAIANQWHNCNCQQSQVYSLLELQEVTPNILQLFQQSHWWVRYSSSPPLDQPYFTLLLYRKDVFTPAAEGFRDTPFENSAMGMACTTAMTCAETLLPWHVQNSWRWSALHAVMRVVSDRLCMTACLLQIRSTHVARHS